MFFKLILKNANSDRIDMTATANEYMTSSIEGLNLPFETISTSNYAGMNGRYLNNAFIENRIVVIHFRMRGHGVEKHRQQLYNVVKPSRYYFQLLSKMKAGLYLQMSDGDIGSVTKGENIT